MERHGSLGSRAKAAGMSMGAYAEANKGASGTLGKLARMYFVAQSPGNSGTAPAEKPGDLRSKGNPLYQVG